MTYVDWRAEIACGISSSNDSVHKHQLQKEQHGEVGPNISLLADELQKQWHDRHNKLLGNILIRPGSNRKVCWLCDQCPDGLPHIWQATVLDRTYGRGCPFCSGRAVCQHNTLAKKAPQVALLWDAKKNHPLSPDQLTVSSNMRAHWKCSACLHEWQAPVMMKARGKTGCPKCAKQTLAGKQTAQGRSILLLQRQSMPCCSNGIMTEIERVKTSPTTRHYAAARSFGGSARNVQRARCTAGRLGQPIEPHRKTHQDAHVALGTSFVSATL